MNKCTKCKKKTLCTAKEEIAAANRGIQSTGDYLGRAPWRTADDWSCCSAVCTNPKCGYVR